MPVAKLNAEGKPDYVLEVIRTKPPHTEVRHTGGGWYLYSYEVKYDPVTKKQTKHSTMTHTIKPDGTLVPARRKPRKAEGGTPPQPAEPSSGPEPAPGSSREDAPRETGETRRPDRNGGTAADTGTAGPGLKEHSAAFYPAVRSLEAGAVLFLYQRTEKMRDLLCKYFGVLSPYIYAAALIRTICGPLLWHVKDHFQMSLLSCVFPGMNFSRRNMVNLLSSIGHSEQRIEAYMRESAGDPGKLRMDGCRLITSAHLMKTAEPGCRPGQGDRMRSLVLSMAALDGEGGIMPVFFKFYWDSPAEPGFFKDFNRCAGSIAKESVIVTDRESCSWDICTDLESEGLRYIYPLGPGSRYLPDSAQGAENEVFLYKGRAVSCTCFPLENCRVHVYAAADPAHLSREDLAAAGAGSPEAGREEAAVRQAEAALDAAEEELEKAKEAFAAAGKALMRHTEAVSGRQAPDAASAGFTVLRTNTADLSAEELFRLYAGREAMQRQMEALDAALDFDASLMQTPAGIRAWLFLNHLTGEIKAQVTSEIARRGDSGTLTCDRLTGMLAGISAHVTDGSRVHLHPLTEQQQELCRKYGLDLRAACASVHLELQEPSGSS